MPSCWVVNFRHNLITLSLLEVFNFLLVSVKRERLLLLVKLRPVYLLIAFGRTKEILNEIHVCAVGGSEIIHDSARCDHVIPHVN